MDEPATSLGRTESFLHTFNYIEPWNREWIQVLESHRQSSGSVVIESPDTKVTLKRYIGQAGLEFRLINRRTFLDCGNETEERLRKMYISGDSNFPSTNFGR